MDPARPLGQSTKVVFSTVQRLEIAKAYLTIIIIIIINNTNDKTIYFRSC